MEGCYGDRCKGCIVCRMRKGKLEQSDSIRWRMDPTMKDFIPAALYCDDEYFDKKTQDIHMKVTFNQLQQLFNCYFVESVYRQDLDHGPGSKCWLVFKIWSDNKYYRELHEKKGE